MDAFGNTESNINVNFLLPFVIFFFFFLFKIYLFIFGCAGSSLLCRLVFSWGIQIITTQKECSRRML